MHYHTSRHSVHACHYHLVWTPKWRLSVLEGEVAKELATLIREICQQHETEITAMEIMPDHVHLLVRCPPSIAIHFLVKQIKGRTATVLRGRHPHLVSRMPSLWSRSYFVATTGGANLETIRKYVISQDRSKRRRSEA